MRVIEAGPLRVWAAGGDDRDGGGDGPSVVLCHGFGAPGNDLVAFHRVLDVGPGVRWFFPEAPHEVDFGYGGAGRAWWQIDTARLDADVRSGNWRDRARETPDGLAPARETLSACLAALIAGHGMRPSSTVVGGFSQGAMITTDLALRGAERFAGLALLSGALLCENEWRAAAEGRAKGLAVFQSHGSADPLLPFAGAEALRDLLSAAGAEVEFVGFRGQHEIPAPVARQLGDFLRRRSHPDQA